VTRGADDDGTDGKLILTGGYFNTCNSADPVLYGGNRTFLPNSDGFTAEIAYQFFGKNNAPKALAVVQHQARGAVHRLQQSSTVSAQISTAWGPTPAITIHSWSISGQRFSESLAREATGEAKAAKAAPGARPSGHKAATPFPHVAAAIGSLS
jgi:hypothetical protein